MKKLLLSAIFLSIISCGPAEGTKGGKCKKSSTADQLAGVVFSGNGDSFYKCNQGLTCNQSKEPFVCEPINAAGEACDRNEVCESGSCVASKCLAHGSVKEGGSCVDMKQQMVFEACGENLFCNVANGGKCLPLQDIGGACVADPVQCKDGLICGPDNTCAAKP